MYIVYFSYNYFLLVNLNRFCTKLYYYCEILHILDCKLSHFVLHSNTILTHLLNMFCIYCHL